MEAVKEIMTPEQVADYLQLNKDTVYRYIREGKLVANITARVVEVMPNGNLALEARKELTINNEKQLLVLTGTVRPNDIDSNNTVLSSKIADAQIYYVGDGVLQDKQSPGWLVRIIDNIWPF